MLTNEQLEEIQVLAQADIRNAGFWNLDLRMALMRKCDNRIIEEMAKEILSLRAAIIPPSSNSLLWVGVDWSKGHKAVTQDNSVTEGYALVPIEPTPEMIAAAMDSDDVTFDKNDETLFYVHHDAIYAAMISSAPKPGKGE
ncbi:hypothetical protein AACK17_16310 [Pectobacterium punjabense]|uniref:hypothetical protein n=1 Tax=Pectobacterium punjabense TaxID=2108399 RepID=UPI00311F104E